MTYLSDVTVVLLMSLVVTFLIVCSVLLTARKDAREAIEAVTNSAERGDPLVERKAS